MKEVSKVSDKTKLFMILAMLEGFKRDLERRFTSCEDCKWDLEYVNYMLNTIDELNEVDNG